MGGVYSLSVISIGVYVPCHSAPSLLHKGGVNPSSTVWKPSSHRVNPSDSEHSLTSR